MSIWSYTLSLSMIVILLSTLLIKTVVVDHYPCDMSLGRLKRQPKSTSGLHQQTAQTRSRYCKIRLNKAFQWVFTGLRGTASMLPPLSEADPFIASSFI